MTRIVRAIASPVMARMLLILAFICVTRVFYVLPFLESAEAPFEKLPREEQVTRERELARYVQGLITEARTKGAGYGVYELIADRVKVYKKNLALSDGYLGAMFTEDAELENL